MRPALNLTIFVRPEGAHESDSNAVEGLVEYLGKRNVGEKVILGDNPCYAGRNRSLAEATGAGIVTSRHGSLKVPPGSGAEAGGPGFSPADFKTYGKGALTGCPRGLSARTPVSRRGGDCNAHFDRDVCGACPCKDLCPMRLTGPGASLRHSLSTLEAARNRALDRTPEDAAKARQRNGIEGTMSDAERVQGTARLRIRGTLRGTGANFLKMLGLIIKRVFNFVMEHRGFRGSP
ncbi:MAG: transposase [Deltaproteobacteria bacterium]|jgi:hypothetical protein|nr:transposase [Deltaproteobacteria bacterium]